MILFMAVNISSNDVGEFIYIVVSHLSGFASISRSVR